MSTPIQDDLDAINTEHYMMQIAYQQGNYEVVKYHADKMISLAGGVKRECALEQLRIAEVAA